VDREVERFGEFRSAQVDTRAAGVIGRRTPCIRQGPDASTERFRRGMSDRGGQSDWSHVLQRSVAVSCCSSPLWRRCENCRRLGVSVRSGLRTGELAGRGS